MKKKRLLQTLVAIGLCVSLVLPVSAKTNVDNARDTKQKIENQLENAQEKISELKEKSASTQEYIDKLDEQLAGLSTQLVQLEKDLADTEDALAETQQQLEAANQKRQKQYDDMKKRIKFMYENGNTAYLEMILQSEDFTDMLNKADYVKAISEYDRNMLTAFQNTVQDIAAKEAQIQQQHTQIEALKTDVENQKASVEAVAETKQQEMAAYKKELAQSEELAAKYEEQLDAQEDLIAQLEAEAARKAAEEQKKKEEQRQKEEEAKARQSANLSKAPVISQAPENPSTTASSSGWVWPCPGHRTINSDYGYRTHPTLGTWKLHNGIDIKASTGTPIVSAASGTVIASAYNSSMGNYVIVDHGGGITTVYMHCSALGCSSGASVSAGQTIAYVGSTGRSTGAHLHFSVRLNSAYVNPWNYVN